MADRSSVGICGGKSKPKINFFPEVDTTPDMSYEISERELFRCLMSDKTAKEIGETQDNETSKILKDIDLMSKITQVETHKSQNVGQIESENIFVVFHTTSEDDGGHWWSLEESAKSVTTQRSHEKMAVKNHFKGKTRFQVEPIAERLKGKGSIKDFFILLWIHIVMDIKCQSFLSRCESFIPLVMKELTETYYEYQPNYFTYSALSSEEINPQMEEIVNLLTKVTKWHPLLCLTYLGDIQRFNQVLGKGFLKNKIDGIYNKLTLLNSAILFYKKEMVQHLLEKKKANARIRDKAGRNALNMAALFTDEEEIIKLLFRFKIKVDACDKSGMTALHYAVISSNLTVTRHLIDHGTDFKRLDPTGHSPLHLAAHYAKDSQILELLLTKVKIDECDLDGITALHSAAIASNAVSARYLIERGADINRRDKRDRTPVHVAAAFAKNVDFFEIFLTNEKADLECCDEHKLTVLAYAKINQYGLAKEIVSGIEKKNNDQHCEYSLAKKTAAGLQQYTGGEWKQKLTFGNVVKNIIKSTPGQYFMKQFYGAYFGDVAQQKLLFVPDADNEPDVEHEISEAALFRFLLNEETWKELDEDDGAEIPETLDVLKQIDKQSKISQVEIHLSSAGLMRDLILEEFSCFIVFKTCATDGDYWWSLEKNLDYIVLQRSRNKENVKDKSDDRPRRNVKFIVENLEGKGTIKDLFEILWAQKMIVEKYHRLNSNSDSFVTFISKKITEIGYEYKGIFPYSPPPESGRDKKMLHLINILTGCSEWPPLFTVILMGNIDLFDKMMECGQYNINACYNGLSPLHFAIMYSKTKMVKHLLKPMNADPISRANSSTGMHSLHVAAKATIKTEIFDLLLAHPKVKIDDVDENGVTALHWAAYVSNVVAVQKLIEKGANLNIFDKEGLFPLDVAALQRDGNPIIDLLLEAPKVKGMGVVNNANKQGWTALHYAALASNEITAEHLIEKGTDLNHRANDGLTPLHIAALSAAEMNIIDLLLKNIKEGDIRQYRNDKILFLFALHNVHGLEVEIVLRFSKKDITPPSTVTDEVIQESDEATGVTRRFVDKGADPSIDLMRFYGRRMAGAQNWQEIDEILKEKYFDINDCDQNGETCLFFAIRDNNVNAVRSLLERGADPTIRNNKGYTPIHLAARYNKDYNILNLLLESGKVGIDERTSQQRWTALHVATYVSNVTAAHFLLSKGANPNVADAGGLTPLHVAEMFPKDMDIVELLVNHQDLVDVNCLDNEGHSALDYARENKRGNGERIANLLKEKDAVERENGLPKGTNEILKKYMRYYSNRKPDEIENCVSDDTITIEYKIAKISEKYLVSAIQDSEVENVRRLLKNGADISACGENGMNALHLASFHANTTDLIDVVLETGEFDINGVDNDGNTPLHWAIKGTNLEKNARHLIGKGADPNIADKNEITPLHLAASYVKEMETISQILEKEQVAINRRDEDGMTALHHAIKAKNVITARCLLGKRADPTIRDPNGTTPFHLAAVFLTDTDVLGLMLESKKKIEIDERNKSGWTALNLAIAWSNKATAEFLLSKGANPNAADEDGATPLHLAAKYAKNMDIVELLLNHKDVDDNCLDNEGRSALHYAMDNEHGLNKTIANRLKKKGAVDDVKEEICRDNLFDECTGEKAAGNFLDKEQAKYDEGETENLKKAAPDKVVVDSDGEEAHLLIKKEAELGKGKRGDHVMNALQLASPYSKVMQLIDVLLETNLYATAAPKCTPDAKNENMVKAGLKKAIIDSDVDEVRSLIEMGTDLSKTTWGKGMNALHVASKYAKTTEILDVVLSSGQFNINGSDEDGWTPLHNALGTKNMTTAHYLLEKGADPTIRDPNGTTPFHLASAVLRDTDVLGLMLGNEKMIEIDEKNEKGWTALHLAIGKSNVTAVHFLLSNGANPNVADEDGATPLHWAAKYANMDMVKLLLNQEKVDVNYLDNEGNNALDYAMTYDHGLGEEIANLLREKMAAKAEGNNHESKNIVALVPPSGIKENSDMETIRFLIENEQDISKLTWGENGANALHVLAAANEETTVVIDAILEKGELDINGVDNDGRTPLHYAINKPDPVTINVRRLIKMGADPSIADKNRVTPLHLAARNAETMDLIEILLNSEAVDVNCVDNEGRTPLAYARYNKHGLSQRIIVRLKEFGAKEGVSLSIFIDRQKFLGKGAYGVVFEGTLKGKKVAVKRIQIENIENNKGEKALQKLDHPNVVKLYHVESNSDFRCYALELCQLSLNQLFNGDEAQKNYQEKMPPEKEVCLQLAKGLAHIHEKGFIYWDIKPQNVFISVHPTDGGNVSMKWADFGLSSPLNDRGSFSTTEHNTRPDNWLAPEILQMKENFYRTTPLRQEGTVKSDVFSAGLIFGFYLLKGRHPYGSQFNIPANIVNDTPVNLKAIEEQKHPMLRAIIMDMLKNNPDERISSTDVITRIANIQ